MKQAFLQWSFKSESLDKIELVNSILAEYEALGYDLSLRQLYYQLVARDYIENSQRSYKRLGDLVNNGRLAGLIDWDMITDRGRKTIANTHWDSPAQIVRAAARQFKIDKWEDQPNYVMVMVEKQALEGVLIPVCSDLDVSFAANKGYSSSSTMYEIGRYLRDQCLFGGKELYVLYLGDHDPSGIDMTRDVQERLEMFSECYVEVRRLALNWDQIEQWDPPENPAKQTDSRYSSYVSQFGGSSWELDAIEPRTLAALVTNAGIELRDADLWAEAIEREEGMKAELTAFVKNYQDGKEQ